MRFIRPNPAMSTAHASSSVTLPLPSPAAARASLARNAPDDGDSEGTSRRMDMLLLGARAEARAKMCAQGRGIESVGEGEACVGGSYLRRNRQTIPRSSSGVQRDVPHAHDPHAVPPHGDARTPKHARGEPQHAPPVARRALGEDDDGAPRRFGLPADRVEGACGRRGNTIRGGGAPGKGEQAREGHGVEPGERGRGHGERVERGGARAGVAAGGGCWGGRGGGAGRDGEDEDRVEAGAAAAEVSAGGERRGALAGMRATKVLATMPSWRRSRRLLSASRARLIVRRGWQWANGCQKCVDGGRDEDVRALLRHTLHVDPPESHRCEGHSCKKGGEQPAKGGVKGRYRALRAIVDTRNALSLSDGETYK